MASHRLASTLLAVATTALVAGCGSGRDTESFLPKAAPSAPPAVPAGPGPAAQAAPVIVPGPSVSAIREREAAAADAARSRQAAQAAEERRRAARKELREERERTARARKRAAEREAALRQALAEARRRGSAPVASPSTPAPRPAPSAPITASDTGSTLVAERDRRSDAEARAAVVRFHELLDASDARACDLFTQPLLEGYYGTEPGALERCRQVVAGLDASVSVVIAESRTRGRRSSVAVVSRVDDREVAQTLQMVLQDGTWRLAAVERRAG